jgi:hypothetical protein
LRDLDLADFEPDARIAVARNNATLNESIEQNALLLA